LKELVGSYAYVCLTPKNKKKHNKRLWTVSVSICVHACVKSKANALGMMAQVK